MLLLQGTSQFCEQLLLTTCTDRSGSSQTLSSAMSVGLVAKKVWNKLVHVQQSIQQLQFEVNMIVCMALFYFPNAFHIFLMKLFREKALLLMSLKIFDFLI